MKTKEELLEEIGRWQDEVDFLEDECYEAKWHLRSLYNDLYSGNYEEE